MEEQIVETSLGRVSVLIENRGGILPVVFMHGVFLDRTLWTPFGSDLTGRTHIYIDMPSHGKSDNIGRNWGIDECVDMFFSILDKLNVGRCIVVGHSWGSMTALRAAIRTPSRFSALALFNMPFRRNNGLRRIGFQLQKLMTVFPRLYAAQAAKALYTKSGLQAHPEWSIAMQDRLAVRSPKEIARILEAVLLAPEDAIKDIEALAVPTIFVVGKYDYVGNPPGVDVIEVPGGHISPHEAPEETRKVITQTVLLTQEDAQQ